VLRRSLAFVNGRQHLLEVHVVSGAGRDEWLAEVRRYRFDVCHGWAFESCDELAQWVMIEHWSGGSWAARSLCHRHCLDVMNNWKSEYRPPLYRSWWNYVDFERDGSWPT
jgi:hypothetical protein